jgi:hypothetical protein
MRVRLTEHHETEIVDRYMRALDGDGPPPGTHRFARLEAVFVSVLEPFSRCYGISDEAWMDAGVSPIVLLEAVRHRS